MAHVHRLACAVALALSLIGCGFEHGQVAELDAAVPTVTVAFGAAQSTVAEASSTVSIPVTLSGVATSTVSVGYRVGQATATRPDDYALSDGTLMFLPGQTEQMIAVTIATDALEEADETIEVELDAPVGATLGSTARHTLTITDDDPLPTVGYAAATSSTSESQAVDLTVQLSAPSGRTASVQYAVTGGTATGADAAVTPGTVVFLPGQTSQTISVAVANDAIDENSETLIVTLSSPVNATLATSGHTLTITDDDDPPQAAFSEATTSVNEAMTAVSLAVQLSSASSFDITVPFTVGGATTADNPEDFTLASTAALMIPAGMTSASVVVNVKADTLDEANETVVIALGSPTNATLGAVASETLTIDDDDAPPTVALTSMGSSPNEGNSNITLTVQLSDISGQAVTVPFTIDAASTAVAPDDYTIAPATEVTIPAGETSTTITIAMKEDALDEGDETVIVVLGTPINATLATPATYTLTIKNDDQP